MVRLHFEERIKIGCWLEQGWQGRLPTCNQRSPVKDIEIKVLLEKAVTDKINNHGIFMKGIHASYHYEGNHIYMTENVGENK